MSIRLVAWFTPNPQYAYVNRDAFNQDAFSLDLVNQNLSNIESASRDLLGLDGGNTDASSLYANTLGAPV